MEYGYVNLIDMILSDYYVYLFFFYMLVAGRSASLILAVLLTRLMKLITMLS